MKKALIHEGKIVEIADKEFNVHSSMKWIDAPDAVTLSWEYDEETGDVSEKAGALDEVKAEKLKKLAAYRYNIETSGLDVGGTSVDTTRGSQALIHGARTMADARIAAQDTTAFDFKGKAGWVSLSPQNVVSISNAVGAHVQACFSNEKRHSEAINKLKTISAVDSYDHTTGWGST